MPSDSVAELRIAVIYHTSYLTKDRDLLTAEWLNEVEKRWYAITVNKDDDGSEKTPYDEMSKNEQKWVDDNFRDFEKHCSRIEIDSFVPVEVEEEIRSLLQSKDAGAAAASARKKVARLVEKHSVIEPILHEMKLSEFDPDPSLGTESSTGRLLMAFAMSLRESRAYTFVIIATDDGGMMYDVAHLAEPGGPGPGVVCVSDPHDPEQISSFLELLSARQYERNEKEAIVRQKASQLRGTAWLLVIGLYLTATIFGIRWLFSQPDWLDPGWPTLAIPAGIVLGGLFLLIQFLDQPFQ